MGVGSMFDGEVLVRGRATRMRMMMWWVRSDIKDLLAGGVAADDGILRK